jgi:ribosomal protein S11
MKYKKKKNNNILSHLYIQCYFKNTIISLTTRTGDVLKQWSTKSLKKTKFKKNTPYNLQFIMNQINKYIQFKKIKKLNIYIKGKGLGRYNIFKNLKPNIKIGLIMDQTFIPFNGCKVRKMKRR